MRKKRKRINEQAKADKANKRKQIKQTSESRDR